MSVRAYRVNEVKRKKDPTFNLWHDEKLMNWIEVNTNFYERFVDDSGTGEIAVKDLEYILSEVKEIDDYIKKEIKDDIAWAKKRGKDCIVYDCY